MQLHVGVLVTLPGPGGGLVQFQHRQPGGNRQAGSQVRLGQQQRNATVLEQVGQAVLGVFRVQRHVGAAGLEDGHEPHHHLHRTLGGDAHQHIRAHAQATQVMGQAVGLGVEFGIAEGAAGEGQRRGSRLAERTLLEQLMYVDAAGVVAGGGVPLLHHPVVVVLLQQVQFAQCTLRLRHELQQQVHQLTGDAADARFGEVRSQVVEGQLQLLAHLGDQGQGVAALLAVAEVAEAQPAWCRFQGFGNRVVLEHQQGVEQRFAVAAGQALHVRQGHVLVVAQGQVLCLHGLGPLGDAEGAVRGGDHRQGVDEQPKLLLDARQLHRAPGHRGAEGHAALAAVALQQEQPGRLHQGVEGDLLLAGEGLQAAGLPGIQACAVQRLPRLGVGHAATGQGQAGRFLQGRQLLQPEALAGGPVLALQPGEVVLVAAFRCGDVLPGIGLQHLTQQARVAPAVHEDVVAGVDQVVAVVAGAQQAQPQQRRPCQIEATVQLVGGTRVQGGGVGTLLHPDLQGRLAVDHLARRVQPRVPDEAGAQQLVAVDRLLPGTGEPRHVEATDVQAHLVDVGAPAGLVQAVEQHALLHGRQRVEGGDFAGRQRQHVQLGLVEPGQRHVAGGQAGVACVAAVLDQRLQRLLVGLCQAGDGGLGEHLAAEGPVQAQLAAEHLAIDAEPVTQGRLRVLPGATAFLGRHPERAFGEVTVELAQVVEGDTRLRQAGERGTGLVAAQVAQQAVAQTLVRGGAQLLLDVLDGGADVGSRFQAHREQAGEPADGARQVDVLEQVLAAVAFQLNQRRGLARPGADGLGQGGQQQVVDLGAVRGRCVLQQLPGAGGVQAGGDAAGMAVVQGARRVVARQVRRRALQHLLPVAELIGHRPGTGVGAEAFAPGLEGRGLGRQSRRFAGLQLAVRGLQVFQQDAPGDAVHHQVMDRQQQALPAVGQFDQGQAQHGAGSQVEAALHLAAEGRQCIEAVQLAAPEQFIGGDRLGMGLHPGPFDLAIAQAQGIVVLQQLGQGASQQHGVQRLARGQQQGLVPVVAVGDIGGEEGLLDRQQRRLAGHRPLVHLQRFAQLRHGGQAADALVLEQVARGDADARLARAADDLDGDDGIPAQFEEVVVHAHLLQAQHVLPDQRQALLQFVARCLVFAAGLGRVGLGQGLAVQLAVGRQRHAFQQHPLRRHHVVRQHLQQACLDALQVAALDFCLGTGQGLRLRHQVGQQLLAAGAVGGHHHGFTHGVLLLQAGFDLAQFDAQATDLHLVVDAPGVFDHPVLALACQVAGAVQALAVAEGAGDEAFGGQRRAAVITACQADAAQVQLAGDAGAHWVQFGVQHVGLQVGDGLADGHRILALFDAGPVGDVDGRFGGAVEVVQAGLWQQCHCLALQLHRQRLAGADDAAQRGAARGAFVTDEGLQHRGHEVQGGDLLVGDQLHQACRVAVVAGQCHHQARALHQRPEELPHRDVEAERRLLQHAVFGA